MENENLDNGSDLGKESGDVVFYNHKKRKKNVKDYLKSQKRIKDDPNGKRYFTNEYKEIKKKEKGNLKVWMDRVRKSQEYGKKIHKVNEEDANRQLLLEEQERFSRWVEGLSNKYSMSDIEDIVKNSKKLNK